jgi:alpha-tubulin suppressor-like RCC1 family protein
MTFQTSARLVVGTLGLLAWFAACSDSGDPGTGPDPVDDASILVSNPLPNDNASVINGRSGLAAVGASLQEETVAYVSLPRGSVPAGATATITSPHASGTLTVPITDGGFDPVPIEAVAGDQLTIRITYRNQTPQAEITAGVPERAPPTIVRTVPPRDKVDVPLNARVVVVFSEPVDPATISNGSIRLIGPAGTIAGTVSLLPGTTAAVVFQASTLLAPDADYRVEISDDVRDLSGDPLQAAVSIEFSTGNTEVGTVRRVTLIPDAVLVAVGSSVQLLAEGQDSLGRLAEGAATSWSSDDPAVASVSASGLVTAHAPGETRIRATIESGTGSTLVQVAGTIAPVASVEVTGQHLTTPAGGKLRLTAIARDDQGNVLPSRAVTWSTNNATIATVRPTTGQGGVVDGLAVGTAAITATIGGISRSASISVVAAGLPYEDIVAGGNIACALTSDSWAMCWGMDAYGGLGTGDPTYDYRPRFLPGPVVGGHRFASLSLGEHHNCGLTADGTAYCWGINYEGQLGVGTRSGPELCPPDFNIPCSTWPAAVAGGRRFMAITVARQWKSSGWTCALDLTGAAFCWGSNSFGQLGLGTTSGPEDCGGSPCSLTPRPVASSLRFTALSGSSASTCALDGTGAAHCWGDNESGNLGDGTTTTRTAPTAVSGGLTFRALTVGDFHACGLTTDDRAYCWGNNEWGQLGTGVIGGIQMAPVPVGGNHRWRTIDAGWAHTCGVATTGATYCWGSGDGGQLGTGTSANWNTPALVAGGFNFTTVSAGFDHTCGLTTSGVAYCWGENDGGQLGNPTNEIKLTPTKVGGQP